MAGDIARVARLLDDLARQKRMCRLHSGVDDGDDHAGAVEATAPGLVRADQGHALRQARRIEGVHDDALDPEA